MSTINDLTALAHPVLPGSLAYDLNEAGVPADLIERAARLESIVFLATEFSRTAARCVDDILAGR